jgi:DNA-binding IclR family transcriptional regulator
MMPAEGRKTAALDRAGAPHSQTLDRGIEVLEQLAGAAGPVSIAALAAGLGVHRSIVYRILRTLEDRRLVNRCPDGAYEPGVGLQILARNVSRDLREAALPELAVLARELTMTAFLVVADREECVTLFSVEPRHAAVAVVARPGSRHRMDRGAPGLALLAGGPPLPGERPEVAVARAAGYATSHDEVIPGLRSVAVPLPGDDGDARAAVAVVYVDSEFSTFRLGERLTAAVRSIAAEL